MKDSYDDIIHLPHHVSSTHPQMSAADRAAQFSPFAALTGYGDIIAETSRFTDTQGKKMGKTAGNAVWLDANKTTPYEFFQYWRNVDDADVIKCLKMLTFIPIEEIEAMESWEGAQLNVAKEKLAFELTAMVHGEEEAQKALDASKALFSAGGNTENMPSTQLGEADLDENGSIQVADLLVKTELAPSKAEAKRLIKQGGISVNDEKVTAFDAALTKEDFAKGEIIVKKGKKVFHKVTLA